MVRFSESEFEGRMEILASMQEMAADDQKEDKAEEKSGDNHQGDDEAIEAAEESFKNLVEAVEEEDWESASSQMTKKSLR